MGIQWEFHHYFIRALEHWTMFQKIFKSVTLTKNICKGKGVSKIYLTNNAVTV